MFNFKKELKKLYNKTSFIYEINKGNLPGNTYYAKESEFCRDHINSLIKYGCANDTFNILSNFSDLQFGYSENNKPINPDYIDIINLIFLAEFFNSKAIVEYGSGCSTSAFFSLQDKYKEKISFESIESSKYWYQVSYKALKDLYPKLVDKCLTQADAEVTTYNNTNTYIHLKKPKASKADFLYVDGPPLIEANNSLDVLFYELVQDQTVIALDGRYPNSNLIYKNLREKSKDWQKFVFRYPSNDTLIISKKNIKYNSFIDYFKNYVDLY